MKNFLMVDKALLSNEELNATEIIIIAQVQEYLRTTGKCFVSNEAFAKMCGCSESTIKRAIDKLIKGGYLAKQTTQTQEGRKRNLFLPKKQEQEEIPEKEEFIEQEKEVMIPQEKKEFIF